MALEIGADKADVSKRLAVFVAEASSAAVAARGKFTVAISGGSLPAILASGLVGEDAPAIDFSKASSASAVTACWSSAASSCHLNPCVVCI